MAKRYPDTDRDAASSTGPRVVSRGERLLCPTHGTPLLCPSCIGARGGRRRSKAKARAARTNARRPRPSARGQKKPRRAAG